MVKLKPIKPKADPFNISAVQKGVRRGMRHAAEDAKAQFEKTTATWKHKPEFDIVETRTGYTVGTDDAIFGYVDKGTPPHDIAPKRGKVLRFKGGYSAKTKPRIIGSGGGGASGDTITAHKVHHPGTEAREFSEIIGEQVQRDIAQYINVELADVFKQGRE